MQLNASTDSSVDIGSQCRMSCIVDMLSDVCLSASYQSRCSVEYTLHLLQIDITHSNQNVIAIVKQTDD